MKKIISLISVLILIFSLAACSNKNNATPEPTTQPSSNDSQEAVAKNDKIERYINKDALKNTDNITIVADKTVNDDEFLLLNIKVDNAVKDGKVNDAAIVFNKLGVLGDFTIGEISYGVSCQSGKGEPCLTWKTMSEKYEQTKIAEDGCWFIVKSVELKNYDPNIYYDIWAKAKNQYVSMGVRKTNGKSFSESEIYEQYNYMREHFTLATVKAVKKTNDDVIWNVPDLKTVTLLDEDQPTKLAKNWVFSYDCQINEYKEKGLNIASLSNMGTFMYNNNTYGDMIWFHFASASIKSKEAAYKDVYYLKINNLEDGTSYDMGKTEKEFTVGKTKFKITEIDTSENEGILKAKTELGNEYGITIQFPGYVHEEIDTDLIQKYTEYFFTAK